MKRLWIVTHCLAYMGRSWRHEKVQWIPHLRLVLIRHDEKEVVTTAGTLHPSPPLR